jgi:hypothetical protein
MGYESRVIVVNVNRHLLKNGMEKWVYAERIADIKMSKMDSDFPKLFTKDIDYKIFKPHTEEETDTDCYGAHIKSADIQTVVGWLEENMKHDDYRRLAPLYGLLKGFNPEQWECLEVLHYGY